MTLDSIVRLNELQNPNLIVPGQRILIPPREPRETT
ncbi:MAG: LysM peptidoglycan-binding domain-containing protein [Chloroflexota bacterium]|nr:LysM peptidoglycan-binding domain-containing protein [Chloroflexota bacterium]